jgi:hypothetical protein
MTSSRRKGRSLRERALQRTVYLDCACQAWGIAILAVEWSGVVWCGVVWCGDRYLRPGASAHLQHLLTRG